MPRFAAQHHAAAALALGALTLAACAGADPARCDVPTDCPSGYCRADHTCAPVDEADAGVDGTGGLDARSAASPITTAR
jgi:hypothetical protein